MDGRVLVVEDEPQVRAMLTRVLGYEGFTVDAAPDGTTAMAFMRATPPDLLLLDLLLPDIDGVDLCRRLRSEGGRVPILMLTARDTVNDRIAGLDAGADDYLVKPFGTAELVARVRALMRRSRIEPEDTTLRFADLTLDPITREVRRDGRAVELTRREFDLLAAFLTRPGAVIDRERLLVDAWGFESPVETNAVDVYVGYLRKKLEADGESRLLWTMRGVGYVLREDRT